MIWIFYELIQIQECMKNRILHFWFDLEKGGNWSTINIVIKIKEQVKEKFVFSLNIIDLISLLKFERKQSHNEEST